MPADTTVPVSDEVWKELMMRKDRGDSFDDVLRRLLGLDDDESAAPAPDDVEQLLSQWAPDTEANTQQARRETMRAYAWLADRDTPAKRSAFVDALADDSELGARSWWERAVQPGLRYLADHDLVEYRPGYHDYHVSR